MIGALFSRKLSCPSPLLFLLWEKRAEKHQPPKRCTAAGSRGTSPSPRRLPPVPDTATAPAPQPHPQGLLCTAGSPRGASTRSRALSGAGAPGQEQDVETRFHQKQPSESRTIRQEGAFCRDQVRMLAGVLAIIGNSQLKYGVIAMVPPGCKQPLTLTASLGKTTVSSPALHFASFVFFGGKELLMWCWGHCVLLGGTTPTCDLSPWLALPHQPSLPT